MLLVYVLHFRTAGGVDFRQQFESAKITISNKYPAKLYADCAPADTFSSMIFFKASMMECLT